MNKKIIYTLLAVVLMILMLIVSFFLCSNQYPNYDLSTQETTKVLDNVNVTIGNETNEVSLPHSFTGLAPRTPVTLNAEISPNAGDSIYIKSVYAPLRVYIDNALIYEYGQDGTYPKFMHDPATGVAIVNLPEFNQTEEPLSIRMEFLSMVSRDTLTIHSPIYGDNSEIFSVLSQGMFHIFMLAFFEIIVGIFLIVISIFIVIFEKKGIIFTWLGLFALCVGSWGLGECNLTALFVQNFTFLYCLTFIGFFTLTIPLFCFAMHIVNFKNKTPILCLSLFMAIIALTSFVAQLFNIVSFPKSMFWFHILIPIALSLFAGLVIAEAIRYRSKGAIVFVLPSAAIAICSILELLNYNIVFTWMFSSIFQVGIIFFIFYTSISSGIYIKDFLRIKRENEKLSFETSIMEYQINAQKKHHSLLIETEKQIKEQRHDLRHHFVIINKFIENNQNQELQKYVNNLSSEIPVETKLDYCENIPVNAIISHYSNLAKSKKIDISIKLSIPSHNEQITDQNICIIVGNLFENAIEACDRMEDGHKFIRLSSYTQQNLLVIVMDNSFNGKYTENDGVFLSQKRNSTGTGTSSVYSVAQRHGGNATFAVDGLVFKSSIYVKI